MVFFGWKMKKEDDRRKMEELYQRMVNQMIKSAEGSAGFCTKSRSPPNGEEERRS